MPPEILKSLEKDLEDFIHSRDENVEVFKRDLSGTREMLRNIFNAMPDPAAIWERNSEGEIILKELNTAINSATQGQLAENIGKRIEEIYGEDSHIVKRVSYVMETGLPLSDPNYSSTHERYFLVESLKVLDNQVLSIAKDYTEDIRIEEELLRSHERYRVLFEYSPVGLFEEDYSGVKKKLDKLKAKGVEDIIGHLKANPDLISELIQSIRIINLNNEVIELYRAKNKADILERLNTRPTLDIHPKFLIELQYLLSGQTNFIYESSLSALDGYPIHTIIGLTVVPGYEKSWERILVSVSDISTRIEAERVKDELEKRRDNFVWMTSHELRTPLTVVMGYCDFLTKHIDNLKVEQRTKIFSVVKHNLTRLERLINDVTILTKIDRGILKIQFEDVNLPELIENTVNLYRYRIGEKITLDIFQEDFVVQVDRERIQQVIHNVLDNAIKNSAKDTLNINVSLTVNAEDYVIIKITDSGAGISAVNLERIFEQFVSIPTEYSSGGTGIGLHLCREIINAHKGSIVATSPGLGKGSTFIITIPKQQ